MRWLAFAVILGCSSSAPPPPTTKPPPIATRPACEASQVGGYGGTPECATVANTVITPADRTCESNADCIRLGPHCAPFAIRSDRTDAYSAVPCTDPASGQCPPPCAAICREGCCVIPAGWGDNCR